MRQILRSLCAAFSMYSRIPMPRMTWTDADQRDCLCFFPLVGVVIGAALLLWDFLAGPFLLGRPLYAVVLALIPAAVTGGIHLDGMLDTADALASHRCREERLAILKDSRVGAFAVLAGIGWFLLYAAIYAEADTQTLRILAVSFVLSRALSALSLVFFPKARKDGLAATFAEKADRRRVCVSSGVYLMCCAGAMLALGPLYGGAGLLGAAVTFFGYRRMARRKFGGVTGDLAGFFLQICELVMAACVIGTKVVVSQI